MVFYRPCKVFTSPAMVCEPEGRRILVLAPHMDDETIGCGGALVRHARKGAHITVIFLTDSNGGSKTLLGLKGEERHQREQELIVIRRNEAVAALEALSIQESFFLDADAHVWHPRRKCRNAYVTLPRNDSLSWYTCPFL